ncbi:MAG: glycosyltransferase [Flavobacteriaceae bacterium]|nr:glycosyltransferase [Flavobacteriaceae bacterium]
MTFIDYLLFLFAHIAIIIYGGALLLILIYCITQLNLLSSFLSSEKTRKSKENSEDSNYDDYYTNNPHLPYVTIQLPLYNELLVVERLLEAVCAIEYPKDKLEIQVLDDSDDESAELTQQTVEIYQKEGVPIERITREKRENFKAGALKYGVERAKGKLIAVFDADFLPQKDWLKKTVRHFEDPQIGVIQTRWSHLNRNFSVLTEALAFALDVHFILEQEGRNTTGKFLNFNGTAGIWRKECILDAGNWQGDTLTEDLDLSYRAQLKNWKFKFLMDVETPAEIPVAMSAIRSQQFRWNKGGAENFQKNVWKLLKSSHLPLSTRFHGVVHLLSSSVFLCVLVISILSVPLIYIKDIYPIFDWFFVLTTFFIICTLIFFYCYWFVHKKVFGGGTHSFVHYVRRFVIFYTLAMALSLHNSVAVIQGHLRIRSTFIRTPKFNIFSNNDHWLNNRYLEKTKSVYPYLEGLLAVYFLFGMFSAFLVSENGDFGLFVFHLVLFLGFTTVFFQSLKH